jgi:putative peptidoglycan binding protein
MAEGLFIPDMVEEDDGGISAEHAPKLTLPLLVAPFGEDEKTNFNTLRRSLVTVACKDVPDSHFAFDSSVLKPESKKGFAKLKGIIDRHPGSPMSIFGHADPEGDEMVYNKFLSERRAEAVFGMLIRDVATWERLFSHHEHTAGDVWGDDAVLLMLDALKFRPDTANAESATDVMKRYQSARGLAPTGRNDIALRAKLFAEYMDFLCSDDKDVPFSATKEDFLGQGDKHGAFQGCSSFNLQLVLAKSEEADFKADTELGKERRHAANADNRRAIIYFFEAGTTIDPKRWPCPRASEGSGKCIAHFWSDGNDRRLKHIPDKRRRFGKAVRNHDERIAQIEQTFACRFYHGLAQHSPCERDLQMWVVQLEVDGPREQGRDKGLLKNLANVRYVITVDVPGAAPSIRGTTTKNGLIGIPLWAANVDMTLRLDIFSAVLGGTPPADAPTDDQESPDIDAPTAKELKERSERVPVDSDAFKDEDDFVSFTLSGFTLKRVRLKSETAGEPDTLEPDAGEPPVDSTEQDAGGRQRLHNLGFGSGNPLQWSDAELTAFVTRFQKEQGLRQPSGKLDDQTTKLLRDAYGS